MERAPAWRVQAGGPACQARRLPSMLPATTGDGPRMRRGPSCFAARRSLDPPAHTAKPFRRSLHPTWHRAHRSGGVPRPVGPLPASIFVPDRAAQALSVSSVPVRGPGEPLRRSVCASPWTGAVAHPRRHGGSPLERPPIALGGCPWPSCGADTTRSAPGREGVCGGARIGWDQIECSVRSTLRSIGGGKHARGAAHTLPPRRASSLVHHPHLPVRGDAARPLDPAHALTIAGEPPAASLPAPATPPPAARAGAPTRRRPRAATRAPGRPPRASGRPRAGPASPAHPAAS